MGSGEEVVQRRTEVVATRARCVGARGGEEGCLEWEEVRGEAMPRKLNNSLPCFYIFFSISLFLAVGREAVR
jgi:hypothetical protein